MSIKYIFSKIRKQTISTSVIPGLLFILFLLIGVRYPFGQIFFPEKLSDVSLLEETYKNHIDYITFDHINLHYTGYDAMEKSTVTGRYFYVIEKNKCYFFLLNSKEAMETEDSVTLENIRFSLKPVNQNFSTLINQLSNDMDWSFTHLSESAPIFLAVENHGIFIYSIIFLLLLGWFIIDLFIILLWHLMTLIYPKLHKGLFPKCSRKTREHMLCKLADELSQDTLNVQCVSTDKRDFFLTKSFIINISLYHTHIIPLKDIIWIYKHIPKTDQKHWDTPGKYTLHLLLKNGQHIPFKNYEETHANALIALLSAKNPDLLIGYSKEHLQLAKQYLSYLKTHN